MSTVKAKRQQIGTDEVTASNNFVVTTDNNGDLVYHKGVHDAPLGWTEVFRVRNDGSFEADLDAGTLADGNVVKTRSGTTVEHESFTGADSEVTVDTTYNTLRVHDGSTPGGHPVSNVWAVDSIADLLALPAGARREDMRYLVKPNNTDIGNGIVRWDEASTANDDGATVFEVSGVATGRFLIDPGFSFTSDFEVTVGSGGHYASINAALDAITKGAPSGQGIEVTIRLLTGFVMQEQIFVRARDLSWITIVADDAEVTIDRDYITVEGPTGSNRYPAFLFHERATGPKIGALFVMNPAQEWTNRYGLRVWNSEAFVMPGCGVKGPGSADADCRSLEAARNSHINGYQSIWDDAGNIGCRVSNNSTANLRESSAKNSNGVGYAISNSLVNLTGVDASGCASHGIDAQNGSSIGATGANCSGSANGLRANQDGVTIAARGIDCSGCSGYGIWAYGAINIDATDANCTGCNIGLYANRGATVNAENSDFSGCNIGAIASDGGVLILNGATANEIYGSNVIRATDGGRVHALGFTANNGTMSGSGTEVIRCWDGSYINLLDADISGNTNASVGISCRGSYVYARNCNARRGVSDHQNDILVQLNRGGVVIAEGSTGGTNRTPNVVQPGGDVIYKNVVTRNHGTATVTSAATSVTVNHGLDIEPTATEIQVTPTSDIGAAAKFWVSNVGATTFDINVDVAPSGDVTFAWRAEKLS